MSAPLTAPTFQTRWTPWRKASLLASSCVFAIASVVASAADVLIVTDRQHPVEVATAVRVIELDAPERLIESELSAHLPSDPQHARTIARQRLRDGGAVFQKRLALAYQAIAEAWSLGITKIPAVVVDRKYVVYGEPDVNRAVSLIEQYRSAQP